MELEPNKAKLRSGNPHQLPASCNKFEPWKQEIKISSQIELCETLITQIQETRKYKTVRKLTVQSLLEPLLKDDEF